MANPPATSLRRSRRLWWLVLLAWLLVAVGCQWGYWAADWQLQVDGAEYQAPSLQHWLGTDQLGRDLLAHTLQGSRIALLVGFLAAASALLLGTSLGLLAAWYHGPLESVINWFSGAVASIPAMLLILVLAALLGPGVSSLCLAFALVGWVGIYRLVRAEARRLVQLEFVQAARAYGATPLRLMLQHLLPALRPLLLAQFGLAFVGAIKAEAILSFLGVGLVEQPSWGRMIADAWALGDLDQGRWWRLAAATVALTLMVLPVYRLLDQGQEKTADSLRA